MSNLSYRDAVPADVPALVAMYADDHLGAGLEQPSDPLPEAYWTAFQQIQDDPRHRLIVCEAGGEVVATLQLSYLPHLAFTGTERAQIEAVRVDSRYRGQGYGEALMRWAIEQARERGCGLMQLTTNTERDAARRFYERLGFVTSHIGMKLNLSPPPQVPGP